MTLDRSPNPALHRGPKQGHYIQLCSRRRTSTMESQYIQQPRTPFVAALRLFAVEWLQDIRHRAALQTLYPDQYPYDPTLLPHRFPYTQIPVGTTPPFLSDFIPHHRTSNQVWLIYYGRNPDAHSLLWMMNFEDILLGVFEIPARIYDDPHRAFPIAHDLVLEGMLESVYNRATFILEYAYHPRDTGPGVRRNYAVEEVHLVNQLTWVQRRLIATRNMQGCLCCNLLVPRPRERCLACEQYLLLLQLEPNLPANPSSRERLPPVLPLLGIVRLSAYMFRLEFGWMDLLFAVVVDR
ncbi:hypothetical protein B0H16DRAFT_1523286 [Mycena metata]|uniref:Uncharacterized protein n=1 Tax=Mycena metata TaxID=1033252 RepID=A0AAD7JJI7_9AGAR|nr:hypothetical protein B0H16DRAFT_1523286 [Mycena metata]